MLPCSACIFGGGCATRKLPSALPSLDTLDCTDLVFLPLPLLVRPLVEDEVQSFTGEGEFENTLPERNGLFFAAELLLRDDDGAELSVELLVDLYEGVGVSSDGDSSKSSSSSISGSGDCWLRGRGELSMGPGASEQQIDSEKKKVTCPFYLGFEYRRLGSLQFLVLLSRVGTRVRPIESSAKFDGKSFTVRETPTRAWHVYVIGVVN